jgi:hypothetical protein
MEFRSWKGFCLCDLGGGFPPEAARVNAPFAPLVFLVRRDPLKSRGCFAVGNTAQIMEPENACALLPNEAPAALPGVETFVREKGATVLNTAFARAFDHLARPRKKSGLTATLVGLGDVGGTLLIALKLLGRELSRIAIYDPNEALCRRYEVELNQVLPPDGVPLPEIAICSQERLFDCDLFLFTASRGVPPVGSDVQDVRMAQFARNREMLAGYARRARETAFGGLFCQISDPVDQLCRAVFLESNRDASGAFDAAGLLPEQVRGFGLGVMAARAAYHAKKDGIDFSGGRVYGPHGADLIVANHPQNYDEALSARLTQETVTANLRVRELGFKPYIAPALSSAAVSLLRLVRGEVCCSAIPMGGAYFGCRSRTTSAGILTQREALHPALFRKIEEVQQRLERFSYD